MPGSASWQHLEVMCIELSFPLNEMENRAAPGSLHDSAKAIGEVPTVETGAWESYSVFEPPRYGNMDLVLNIVPANEVLQNQRHVSLKKGACICHFTH